MPRHSEVRRKRQKTCSLLLLLLFQEKLCFLQHPQVPGGLIHDVGMLVVGSAVTDFKESKQML